MLSVAGLGSQRGSCSCVDGRRCPVCGRRVVGRVVVGRLRGRVRRLLVVDRVVGGRGGRLPLLVSVSRRSVCGCPCEGWRARGRNGLDRVIIVYNNDLGWKAVLVEGIPIRLGSSMRGPFMRMAVHGMGGRLAHGRQLLWLSVVGRRRWAHV